MVVLACIQRLQRNNFPTILLSLLSPCWPAGQRTRSFGLNVQCCRNLTYSTGTVELQTTIRQKQLAHSAESQLQTGQLLRGQRISYTMDTPRSRVASRGIISNALVPPLQRPATSPYFAKPFLPDPVVGGRVWALQLNGAHHARLRL